MIFVGETITAQKKTLKFDPIGTSFHATNHSKSIYNIGFSNTGALQQKAGINTSINFPISTFSIISPNYYTQNFGFFCKKELQMEKVTKLPIKIRLGTVQQCDWMEGKPNAVKAN
ncbi:MAG: hypothetical protein WDM90_15485 [Ferruginibacter sp.]